MTQSRMTPPLDDQGMEDKLISLAMQEAQRQMESGTASAQVITHFLKLGSKRAEVELEKIRRESDLIKEKIESEQSGQKMAEMIEDVLDALRSYSYRPPGANDADVY